MRSHLGPSSPQRSHQQFGAKRGRSKGPKRASIRHFLASQKATRSVIVVASLEGIPRAPGMATTSTTNHTAIHGPEDDKFGILGSNIIIRLLVYYLALALLIFVSMSYLPASWAEALMSATRPLLGMAQPVTTFTTPDPRVESLAPIMVILMGIVASTASILLCL